MISHLDFGSDVSGATHTALPLPGRDLVVVTDEAVTNWRNQVQKQIRLVDVSDERRPKVISEFPIPQGDFVDRPGRFGPHNLNEMRPGSFRSDHIVHATYFSAGLRIYDVADPTAPCEVGYYVPEPYGDASSVQLNDLTVTEDGLIYVTDRVAGGLYVLEPEIDFG
jgi:hypothetical protein